MQKPGEKARAADPSQPTEVFHSIHVTHYKSEGLLGVVSTPDDCYPWGVPSIILLLRPTLPLTVTMTLSVRL